VSVATHCQGSTDVKYEEEVAQAQKDSVDLKNKVFAEPNSDKITHPCHFEKRDQLNQFAEAWFKALTASGIFGAKIKTTLDQ